MVQRQLYYAIVDEVDSILIDEARTPLIISGQVHDATELYASSRKSSRGWSKTKTSRSTRRRTPCRSPRTASPRSRRCSASRNLYDQRNLELTHQLNAALKAWNSSTTISSTSSRTAKSSSSMSSPAGSCTGGDIPKASTRRSKRRKACRSAARTKRSRRSRSRIISASTSKLAGMTGTAKTEEREFREIYGLDVVVMPTNCRFGAKTIADIVYRTENAKFEAVVDEIIAEHDEGRPVLVGTRSIEKSRAAGDAAAPARRRVQRAQREVSRAGSADHQGCGAVGRGDDRDQHGRPRRRHQARRRRGRRSAACTSSAPSGTNRGASTTSCAAAPAVRAIPARRASTSRSTTN